MKLGLIGEEMIATAVKLAQERGSDVEALHVVRVPLERPLDAPLADPEERRAAESIEEARLLGEDHGVVVRGDTVRARAIGEAIVDEAIARDVDLIVLGSAPRWRRQSRFFSPTVEYVLRRAPCEVLVVAFPESACGRGRCVRKTVLALARSARLDHVKAVVIGCGRVGSNVAKRLASDGWEVSVLDDKEEALSRLGETWQGRFIVGHGMDAEVLRRPVSRTPTPSSWRRTATTRTSSSRRSPRSGSRSRASSCACSTRAARSSTRRSA